MNRLMRVELGTKGCFLMLVLSCIVVSLLAGSEPAVRPVFHFGMDIEDATQTSGRTAEQHPWLEYSVWQDQEWVRIYTPGQPQLWQPEEAVPELPDNSFREWKRVTMIPLVGLVNTVRRGQFATGNIKVTNAFFLALSPSPRIKPGISQNSDIIRVEEMFTYAPPISDGDRSTALQLPPVFYGDTRNAHRGDLSFPSSERLRAVSRSPRRCGYFGKR